MKVLKELSMWAGIKKLASWAGAWLVQKPRWLTFNVTVLCFNVLLIGCLTCLMSYTVGTLFV